jgi:hypothetical protein
MGGIDPSCSRALNVYTAEEISSQGGKEGLKGIFQKFRKKHLLRSEFKGKKFVCIFFFDKDIDCICRSRLRNAHAFYTELYDVEAQAFRDGNLTRSIAVALGISMSAVPSIYSDPSQWIEGVAVRWKEWLTLCVYCKIHNVNCGCGFRLLSTINPSLIGPTDVAKYYEKRTAIKVTSGVCDGILEQQMAIIEKKIGRLIVSGELLTIFKGKWIAPILRKELEAEFPRKNVVLDALEPKLTSGVVGTMSFSTSWATECRDRLRELVDEITVLH